MRNPRPNHPPDPRETDSAHGLFTDHEADRLASVATVAGAGTLAQACLFPAHGVGAGFVTGMLVCLPGAITEYRNWRGARALKTAMAMAALAVFTLAASAISNAGFAALGRALES
ncbi:MAG: hypothetical protein E7K47_04870 [Acidovorax sp.]|jgi:hypothetical protein|nr:hypothetical protein [Acidovorax sp.]